jgi:hypothetical protein
MNRVVPTIVLAASVNENVSANALKIITDSIPHGTGQDGNIEILLCYKMLHTLRCRRERDLEFLLVRATVGVALGHTQRSTTSVVWNRGQVPITARHAKEPELAGTQPVAHKAQQTFRIRRY